MKCDGLNYCLGFQRVCNGIWPSARDGIIKIQLLNLSGDISTIAGVVVKDNKKRKPVALNYCPICGFSYSEFRVSNNITTRAK